TGEARHRDLGRDTLTSSSRRKSGSRVARVALSIETGAMDRTPCVYMVASGRNGTIYVGVTSDLLARIYQHREGIFKGFTSKYRVNRLVWFEVHEEMESAIIREKRLKEWQRAWKVELIEATNPQWRDLAEDFGFD